ncbi:hypothetical protein [Spirochaeta lutea]|uniref:Uncharacterized protein n=1 Tax=Spirochaeta lutea TaxID=1480694 RepID=A0A098R2C9_9SPIO|nr:hypothetical protein [Spirochaeta lutea]KGE73941.1 hypothetical protein DC28_01825 [Spirochaeta lutea]
MNTWRSIIRILVVLLFSVPLLLWGQEDSDWQVITPKPSSDLSEVDKITMLATSGNYELTKSALHFLLDDVKSGNSDVRIDETRQILTRIVHHASQPGNALMPSEIVLLHQIAVRIPGVPGAQLSSKILMLSTDDAIRYSLLQELSSESVLLTADLDQSLIEILEGQRSRIPHPDYLIIKIISQYLRGQFVDRSVIPSKQLLELLISIIPRIHVSEIRSHLYETLDLIITF